MISHFSNRIVCHPCLLLVLMVFVSQSCSTSTPYQEPTERPAPTDSRSSAATNTSKPLPKETPPPTEFVLTEGEVPPEGVVAQLLIGVPTPELPICPVGKPGLRPDENIDLGSREILKTVVFCLDGFTAEAKVELSDPDGDVLTLHPAEDWSRTIYWHFQILPGSSLGPYSISVREGNLSGSAVVMIERATWPKMSIMKPSEQVGGRFNVLVTEFDRGLPNEWADTAFAVHEIQIMVAGFAPDQDIYLYRCVKHPIQGRPPCMEVNYLTRLPSPTLDEHGEGIYVLPTIPPGAYLIDVDGYPDPYRDLVFEIVEP